MAYKKTHRHRFGLEFSTPLMLVPRHTSTRRTRREWAGRTGGNIVWWSRLTGAPVIGARPRAFPAPGQCLHPAPCTL